MPKTRRSFTDDFRTEAVNLLITSGRPLNSVASELGITSNSLRSWRNRLLGKGHAAKAGSTKSDGHSAVPLSDPIAENRRLHREVAYLRRQREILKKAMSILSEDPSSGMR
ncbi:MAG TPA: hypothetical protein EYQ50_23405 [Verrucomicrobiales bacterium]|jgi:transposase|nr:hypothetical protein [Verrucomicrobiales bacterium]